MGMVEDAVLAERVLFVRRLLADHARDEPASRPRAGRVPEAPRPRARSRRRRSPPPASLRRTVRRSPRSARRRAPATARSASSRTSGWSSRRPAGESTIVLPRSGPSDSTALKSGSAFMTIPGHRRTARRPPDDADRSLISRMSWIRMSRMPAADRATEEALAERALEDRREDGEDVDPHGWRLARRAEGTSEGPLAGSLGEDAPWTAGPQANRTPADVGVAFAPASDDRGE